MSVAGTIDSTLAASGALSDADKQVARDLFSRYDKIRALLETVGFKDMKLVADYGCGHGAWLWPLAELNQQVIGMDINADYVDAAERIAKAIGVANVRLICAPDLRSIPTQELDGIICIGTLQVVGTGELWHSFFQQAGRVLKPGGKVLCHCSSPRYALEQIVTLEPFRLSYLRHKGLLWCLDRFAGWVRLFMRAVCASSIEPNGRYYGVRRSVARKLFRQSGFAEIAEPRILSALRDPDVPSYRGRHDHWFLLQKRS